MNQPSDNVQTSFFTICWEGDWECLLVENRLERIIESCNHAFTRKGLIITNVSDRPKVEAYAKAAVSKGIIDEYYFSSDHEAAILKAYNLNRKTFVLDFFDGYVYSIGPLTAIYKCNTEMLMYCTGDCLIKGGAAYDWITEAVAILRQEPTTAIVCPKWDYENGDMKRGAVLQKGTHYYDQGFSDQFWVVRTKEFQRDIYNEYNVMSERYPVYGGNLFERRVDSYIRSHNLLRCVFSDISYTHEKLLSKNYLPLKKSKALVRMKTILAVAKRGLRKRSILQKFLFR